MPAADFKTIPDELLHVAEAAEVYFGDQGFDIQIERREIGFPAVPALLCRRGHELVIVEIFSALDVSHVDRWIRYCRSQVADTRYCMILRSHGNVSPRTVTYAADNRLGLGLHDDHQLTMIRQAPDLAVHLALPELKSLAKPLRAVLAPAFQKILEGDWRDGLGDACLAVEQRARDYLKAGIDSERIIIVRGKKNPKQLTPDDVEDMSLGQLKVAFSQIQSQNHQDSLIGATLSLINKPRVGLAHKRKYAKVEAELRQQIGQSMHAIIACLEEMMA